MKTKATLMRRQIVCILYLSIPYIIIACSDDYKTPNKVVLTFENWSMEPPFPYRIKYVDDYLIPHLFVPGEFQRDKCVIPTSREYIDVALISPESITRHFLIRNGDSVRFNLELDWPVVTVLNREAGDNEANFERFIERQLLKEKSSALEDYHYYWSKTNRQGSPISSNVISEELQSLKKKALTEIKEKQIQIDSLLTLKIVSPEIADFFKLKNAYMLEQFNLFDEQRKHSFDNSVTASILSNVHGGLRDSLNYIPTFYDDYITLYYSLFLTQELGGNTNLDSLIREYYPTLFGKSLLFKHVDKLLLSSSVKNGKQLLKSFSGDSLLQHWSKYLSSKYNLDQKFDTNWSISNNWKEEQTFGSLLLEKRGTLLYVDLWASWCVKGIRELPALEVLYNDYQGKGVSIVHISADSEFEKWEWANKKYLSFNLWNSYLLRNSDVPTVSESFGNALPKYLLFNQNGELLHGNAPSPSSEEIRILIDQYLKDATGI